ncbi:MAG: BTAD domain-containing putative transcriptional regulator [Gaiellaceae bacterium]
MEFLILGPLEVRDGQRTTRLGSAKQRALLGVLVLHANETVSVARLVDELWGERPPATAEKLVQGYVHALRKQLGDGVLQTRPPGYRLSVDPRSFDLAEFERLLEAAQTAPLAQAVELRRRALALWRGPPLADVSLEGPTRHTLARLADLRVATQIDQISAQLEHGRHAQVIGELETLVAEHPYQERLAAQLMLALYRAGRQADALKVYRTVRGRLSDELGLEPGQELRDLEARILRHDPALTLPVSPQPTATPAAIAMSEEERAPRRRRFSRRRGLVLGLGMAVGIAALLVALGLFRSGEPAAAPVPPNTLAFIDPATNRVDGVIPVGIRPGVVASGAGALWVGNLEDETLTRIDPESRSVVRNIPLGVAPDAIAVGAGSVWIVNGRLGTLYRVDPDFNSVSDPITLGERAITYVDGGVDFGGGQVWAVFADSTVARVDPVTLSAATARVAGVGPASVLYAFGSVWVSTSDAGRGVQRFNPDAFREGAFDELAGGRTPGGLAAGAGSMWVANTEDDSVTRIDPATAGFNASLPIEVGDGPVAVAVGVGAAWVANTAAGTVSRIDPETNEVVATIEIGNAPTGIAIAGGIVAVSVQSP